METRKYLFETLWKRFLTEQTKEAATQTLIKQGYVEIPNSGFDAEMTYRFKHNNKTFGANGELVTPENGPFISVVEKIPNRTISIVTKNPVTTNISSTISTDKKGRLYYSGLGQDQLKLYKVFERK
jgi:hypothetical protein